MYIISVLINLSLQPTTVYIPALVMMSEASDFSESIWIQSFHDFNQFGLMKCLVGAAIAREEKSHPNAHYQVLVKAIGNHKYTALNVNIYDNGSNI